MDGTIEEKLPKTAIVTFKELEKAGVKQKQVENWVNRGGLLPMEDLPIRYHKYFRADILPFVRGIGTKGRPKKEVKTK